ncbi:hypothetical protein CXG81DRAFT_18781 [Caulochytrium protostelioides]|uniref:PPP4R2-domain-containing protein n=1 Tax=Caulochytrium protostelioides TaxID=1555241 RepID=A0A4P9X827_9FUNG|nr:hypothetical protein CXG81DRAFT_18781 [Caulochytrium protostelioides]|eukprot:RKP01413.1 hypothetical protein CXG81DRAFT_18781 [Caulochytrium protostelioides]
MTTEPSIEQRLAAFAETPAEQRVWRPEYDEIIGAVADTSELAYPWDHVKELIKFKIAAHIHSQTNDETGTPVDTLSAAAVADPPSPGAPPVPAPEPAAASPPPRQDALAALASQIETLAHLFTILDQFDEPPFTLQRLAELALYPTQNHKTVPRYLRALERTLLVTSMDDAVATANVDAAPVPPPSDVPVATSPRPLVVDELDSADGFMAVRPPAAATVASAADGAAQ